ncbi:1604_t:CDS:2, partial [Acaulospora colombiana]
MSERGNQTEVKGEIESESITRSSSEETPVEGQLHEIIILNVGGIKLISLLLLSFLMLHPTNGNEYFIDRNGYAFHYVMEFYRTGTIVWRPALESPNCIHSCPRNSSTPHPISSSSTSSYTEINNATVPTRAAAAFVAISPQATSNGIGFPNNIQQSALKPITPPSPPPSNPVPPEKSSCCHYHSSPRPYISLPELEQEFNYFQIPFTSQVSVAHKAAGELLDSFAYAVQELLCASIAKLIDRVWITFYRDGSQMECIIPSQVSKLREFSLNGYCIINHFYDDIKKYLET